MKAEFELTVNDVGEPEIKFRHHDKSSALEQKLLKQFIDNALKHGLEIKHPSGYLESGTQNSWENYIIKTKLDPNPTGLINDKWIRENNYDFTAKYGWVGFSKGDKSLIKHYDFEKEGYSLLINDKFWGHVRFAHQIPD